METPPISLSHLAKPESGEDPWDERFQAGCIQEAGSSQPLVFSPRAEYLVLRRAWARSILFGGSAPQIQGNSFQPLEALRALVNPKRPFVCVQFPSGAALSESGYGWKEGRIPRLAEACQMALLWKLLGKEEAANSLAKWLSGWIQDAPLFSLWRPENDTDETECYLSFSLLCRAMGERALAAAFLKKASGPVDPFFFALAKLDPKLDPMPAPKNEWSDPYLGLGYFRNAEKSAALTLCGLGTSLGAVRTKDVEIRAMGPQGFPLGKGEGFGIDRQPDGAFMAGWTRLAASPEAWMHLKADLKAGTMGLKFMGLKPEEPVGFVYYVKAGSCSIDGQVYKPKSLQRFAGSSASFLFRGKESQLKIECEPSLKGQLIPLAGEAGFWNADFLLSFEIPPFASQVNFSILN